MNRSKKIRYIIYAVIGVLILTVGICDILTNYYGYDDVGIFPPPNPNKMGFLKDSTVKQITLEALYKKRSGDSIYVAKYKNDNGFILWRIDQYKNTSLSGIVDTTQMPFEIEQLTFYENISPKVDTHVAMESNIFLHDGQSVSIHFYNCKEIQCLRRTNNYQYYHLKGGFIFLVSGRNKYCDASIGFVKHTDVDFLVRRLDKAVYVAALYSLKDSTVAPEELFNMFNRSFL